MCKINSLLPPLIKVQQNIVLPLILCVISMFVKLEIFKLPFLDKKSHIQFILSLSFSSLWHECTQAVCGQRAEPVWHRPHGAPGSRFPEDRSELGQATRHRLASLSVCFYFLMYSNRGCSVSLAVMWPLISPTCTQRQMHREGKLQMKQIHTDPFIWNILSTPC